MGRIFTEDTFRVLLSGAADPDRPIGVRSSFRGIGLGPLTESGLAPLLDPVIVKVTLPAALALTVTLRAAVASLALALLALLVSILVVLVLALALLFILLTLLLLLVLVLLTTTYYLDLLAGQLVLLRS